MICYRCGSVLSDDNLCHSCGADVSVYKKVIGLSNAYYNMGLAKASVRDLASAADYLRRSIKFDKRNINARNLLGLVYFEMGEAVQALSEWVISKNFQPDDNRADIYIKELQSNPTRLDTINQTIKKFNIALGYAQEGNDDLAVIQLKKVLNLNPNLIKGHLILALLYMKRGDYDRAKKPVMKVLKIDANNVLAKKYLAEIENKPGKKNNNEEETVSKSSSRISDRKRFKPEFDTGANEPLSGYDVIIPNNGYKESNNGTIAVLNVIIGIIIGVAATFFLITPARVNSLNSAHKKEVVNLNSQIASLNSKITDLNGKLDEANSGKADLQNQIDTTNNENNSMAADYERLVTALIDYQAKSYVESAEQISSISGINSPDYETKYSESFRNLCGTIKDEVYTEAAKATYSEAVSLVDSAYTLATWDAAVTKLEKCFAYDYKSIDYSSLIEKLNTAYTSRYQCAQTEDAANAASYKEKAVSQMQNIVNIISADSGVSTSAVKTAQDALAALQAM